ncbi:hypothetical protein [Xylanimonas sp. McL0601]|uniref:hypothetical protein n=1 Tax=Xylanimonas sp. McL0601 TaxID=3414739 RepID=UPI003CEE2491
MSARRVEDLRPEPAQPGRVLDARLHLLDRQVLDRDGVPVTVLDDLELTDPEPGGGVAPYVTALLSGPVLGARVFGGRPPRSRWHPIPWRQVTDVGTAVRLSASGKDLDVAWVERWVRDQVIGRIPGGRHDPEGEQ